MHCSNPVLTGKPVWDLRPSFPLLLNLAPGGMLIWPDIIESLGALDRGQLRGKAYQKEQGT